MLALLITINKGVPYDVAIINDRSNQFFSIFIFVFSSFLNNFPYLAQIPPPGGRLNKKDGLTRYGDPHVKDKTS